MTNEEMYEKLSRRIARLEDLAGVEPEIESKDLPRDENEQDEDNG